MDGDLAVRLKDVTVRFPVGSAGRGPRRSQGTVGGPLSGGRRSLAVTALNKVSFTVAKGQRVGIIGHNGAGKTALLRVMAGIYTPTSGSCETRGRISTMFSNVPGIYYDATGLEYATLFCLARGLGRKEIKRLLPEIVRFSEIGDYLHFPLRMYSAGMKVRIAFAMAVCIDWDLLLIDEDIVAGDPRFHVRARELVTRKVAEAGTLVVASQSARIIREFCDVAVWIEKGRVLRIGDVGELLDVYHAE